MSSEENHLADCLNGWTGAELEFLAEDVFVDIKPSFSQDVIPLLGGSEARGAVGPFRPPLPASVPLWMAVLLKKQRKCELVVPEWMSVSSLDAWLDFERSNDQFREPPCVEFVEVSRVLLTYAREDLGPDVATIEERLGDIQDVRQAKIKNGFNLLNDAQEEIKMRHLGSMEVNTLRSFAVASLAAFKRLHGVAGGMNTDLTQSGAGAATQAAAASAVPALSNIPAAQSMNQAQRNNLRNAASRQLQQHAAASSSASQSAASQPSSSSQQPGAAAAQPEQEQARKLRRFG